MPPSEMRALLEKVKMVVNGDMWVTWSAAAAYAWSAEEPVGAGCSVEVWELGLMEENSLWTSSAAFDVQRCRERKGGGGVAAGTEASTGEAALGSPV
jgi:hypothetical protein